MRKCTCGKTKDPNGNCDGSHNNKNKDIGEINKTMNMIYNIENAVDEKDCVKLIKEFNKHKWLQVQGRTGGGLQPEIKESTDISFHDGWRYISELEPFHAALDKAIGEYREKYQGIVISVPEFKIFEEFNMQWYKPGEGYHQWHAEHSSANAHTATRIAAWMFNLNTVEDGGETIFMHHDDKIKPKVGSLTIFPADWTYTHKGVVAPNEDKYILTGWLNSVIKNG